MTVKLGHLLFGFGVAVPREQHGAWPSTTVGAPEVELAARACQVAQCGARCSSFGREAVPAEAESPPLLLLLATPRAMLGRAGRTAGSVRALVGTDMSLRARLVCIVWRFA